MQTLRFMCVMFGFVMGAFNIAKASNRNPLDGKTLLLHYNDGPKFRVEFKDENLTWTGIEGPDQGRQETDAYRWAEAAPDIYFVSWTENDGTFVTMVMNLHNARVLSSGNRKSNSWFWSGVIQQSEVLHVKFHHRDIK